MPSLDIGRRAGSRRTCLPRHGGRVVDRWAVGTRNADTPDLAGHRFARVVRLTSENLTNINVMTSELVRWAPARHGNATRQRGRSILVGRLIQTGCPVTSPCAEGHSVLDQHRERGCVATRRTIPSAVIMQVSGYGEPQWSIP
jgi:hypothetical protein